MSADQAMDAARAATSLPASWIRRARSICQILRASPNHPDVLTLLGSTAYQLGDDETAAAHVDTAIRGYRRMLMGAPDNAALRAQLANLLLARDPARRGRGGDRQGDGAIQPGALEPG